MENNKLFTRVYSNSAIYNFIPYGMKKNFIGQFKYMLEKGDFEKIVRNLKSPTTISFYNSKKEFEEFKAYIAMSKNTDHLTAVYATQVLAIMLISDLKNTKDYDKGFVQYAQKEYEKDFEFDHYNKNSVNVNPFNKQFCIKIKEFKGLFKGTFSCSKLMTIYLRYVMAEENINYYLKRIKKFDEENEKSDFTGMFNSEAIDKIQKIINSINCYYKQNNLRENDALNVSFSTIVETEMIRHYYKMDYKDHYPECPPISSKPKQIYVAQKTTKEEIGGSVEVNKNPIQSSSVQSIKETTPLQLPEPVVTKRPYIQDDDEFIIMEILKLRRQLKHTTIEITIKDKE